MENNEGRNYKQTYLRTHIIEQGYSPEEFLEFIKANKENGSG
jgi:hypothetical protein